jgi:hypothetical protein
MLISRIKARLILFLVCWTVAVAGAKIGDQTPLLLQVVDTLKALFGRQHSQEASSKMEPQPLLVINAGHARTGTASFVRALERLGLNCYHMKEGVIETEGHMELWSRVMVEKTLSVEDILDEISNAGFNASADAPINFFYKEQMQRYPDAPVILTIRSDDNPGHAWQRSLRDTVLRFPSIFSNIPFRFAHKPSTMAKFLHAVFEVMLPDAGNSTTGVWHPDAMARVYEDWIQEVKATVPRERLLVFKASDGWGPLCEHIAHVSPIVASNCKEVLQANEPYPHINDTKSMQRIQFSMKCVTIASYTLLVTLAMLILYRVKRTLSVVTKNKDKTR